MGRSFGEVAGKAKHFKKIKPLKGDYSDNIAHFKENYLALIEKIGLRHWVRADLNLNILFNNIKALKHTKF